VVSQLTGSSHRVSGITLLDNRLYVLRCRDSDQIEVYQVGGRFQLERCLFLPRLYRDDWNDLAGSARHRCLYVSNFSMNRLQRVDPVDSSVTLWPLPGSPCGLSTTQTDNLLVTFHESTSPGWAMEIDGSGNCVRRVVFEEGVLWAWHTVEVVRSAMPQFQYLVSHGYYDQHDHCVSVVGAADGQKFRGYGGIPGGGGADLGKLYVPYHLAVDEDGCVFVADHHNGRVVVLSSDLEFVRCLGSVDGGELKSRPRRLCLSAKSRLLYVGQDDGTVAAIQLEF